ncbi:hypothetical protein B7760_02996 [Burkholderia glumae]|nr:hypothetical protein B7760_02996 [Burkholderia glumae]
MVVPSVRRVVPASLRVISEPPPWMMLESCELRSPLPNSAAFSGVLK